jgi:hypothetical protein
MVLCVYFDVSQESSASMFTVKYGGGTFLRNVGNHRQHYTAYRLRRPQSIFSPHLELQKSNSYRVGGLRVPRTFGRKRDEVKRKLGKAVPIVKICVTYACHEILV